MRYAFLSDIHANWPAFEAVLKSIGEHRVDQTFCLGDVVGYAASPKTCLDAARANCDHLVMGNHDAMAALDVNLHALREDVAAGLYLARDQLTRADRGFMRRLPLVHHFDGFVVTHASLEDPLSFEYIDSPAMAAAHLARQEENLCFVGHTHVPRIYARQGKTKARNVPVRKQTFRPRRDRLYVVNVGSVGQPRDRHSSACWVMFDSEEYVITWHRVEYDIERAASDILDADLPEISAARLFLGR